MVTFVSYLAMNDNGGEQRKTSSMWKSFLYQLQQEAPKPAAVLFTDRPPDSPLQYGLEYHGNISRHKCQDLLLKEGSYMVRLSDKAQGFYTLSLRFNNQIKHYRLYYADGKHYVGEKRFNTLHDLVQDGLVTQYIELKAGEFLQKMSSSSYVNSPHYTLTRSIRKQIQNSHKVGGNKENKKPSEEKIEGSTFYVGSDDPIVLENDNTEVSEPTTQRPHRFNPNTFTGLHWCGLCGHFLWGLVQQGSKCVDCGFKAHKQCSYKVPNDCCPHLKDLQSIFGVDLTTSLGSRNEDVPGVILECIAEVEARGLTSEGIYRVPGSLEQIEALKLAFERDGENVSLNERCIGDINVVAGLLKLYLRLLPIPLITYQCFTHLNIASKLSDPDGRISGIKDALEILPIAHKATLKAVIMHLGRVYEHCAVNKMTATGLSTVFAPTLIQSAALNDIEQLQPTDLLALANSSLEPRVVEVLIIYHQEIF